MQSGTQHRNRETGIAVIGGGLVGGALAYGLARLGRDVRLFDEGDVAFRASRGNFGLVWVQTKGANQPAYARWSWLSSELWQGFARDLEERTGQDLQLQQEGGLIFCEDDAELQEHADLMAGIRDSLGGDYPYEMLAHNELKRLLPDVGPTVPGASWCPLDGHVNPLKLMLALHQAFVQSGGNIVNGSPVEAVRPVPGGFEIIRNGEAWFAEKVVLAAGLGNRPLGEQLGLNAPVAPNRGQVLITERLKPFLRYPTVHVRQTGDGTVQIGDSKENAGFDCGTSLEVYGAIARRAVRFFPKLESVRLVRAWGALRVMSPDGLPIYEESARHPGAYVVTCHSGVTLAAAHAGPLARWISGGDAPDHIEHFSGRRFHVQAD